MLPSFQKIADDLSLKQFQRYAQRRECTYVLLMKCMIIITHIIMAVVHDAAVFGYTVYSQGTENFPQNDDVRNEEKSSMLLSEPCFCTKEDFIVLAEFSEVTGPVPLLTIPSNAFTYGDVDVNALIMKIMSVDYQANPSGQFAFCKDVQVLQYEVLPGWHAYVHYCTLHDLRARGFVRPLCLAYVSADLIKLQNQFNELREKFLSAVGILKYNNRQSFINEISKIIANLKETQNQYFIWKKKEDDGEYLSPEEYHEMSKIQLDQLAHQQTELHHMLLTAEILQDNRDIETQIHEWQCALERSRDSICEKFVAETRRFAASVPSTSAASVGPPSLREVLRPVAALCPWGAAAALCHLLAIQRTRSACRLRNVLHMFPPLQPHTAEVIDCPSVALSDPEYLQLLSSASAPFHWPDSQHTSGPSSPPVEVLSPESLEYMEANLITSGNEASSSYHSAPESLSEVMIAIQPEGEQVSDKRSGSLESFLDVPSDSDSCEEPPIDEENESNVLDTWVSCSWSVDTPIGINVAGKRISRFFQRYPRAALHVLYSILMGRTVVLAAGEALRAKVRSSLVALAALVPTHPPRVLWWHRGILVSSHVSSHCLIGICVPERLSVHDMISPRDKNLVTILEMVNGRLCGPAYSGHFLSSLEIIPNAPTCDQSVLLLLQAIADGLKEKLFVLNASTKSVTDTLALLDVTGSDADILKYLSKTGVGQSFLK